MLITSRCFDPLYPEIREYTLTSDQLIVKVLNLGATITSIIYREDGSDVVLGYDCVDDYKRSTNYFGATIGRCANRIRRGKFTLNGRNYQVPLCGNVHSIHGGEHGFHTKIFDVNLVDHTLMMSYFSKHMEEGFPGNLEFVVLFDLQDDTLHIQYRGVSDIDTILNVTNHSYFALQGHGRGSIDHQSVKMRARNYVEIDEDHLATNQISNVLGTPFDFTKSKKIGEDIKRNDHIQIRKGDGYDHYFLFDQNKEHSVEVVDSQSKHSLIVKTDLPGFQFYVPDYKDIQKGKQNASYIGRCAVCIETSFMPDAMNQQVEPETILKANKVFESKTTYTFK